MKTISVVAVFMCVSFLMNPPAQAEGNSTAAIIPDDMVAEAIKKASYGDLIVVSFDIASMRIGSSDADRSGTAEYVAPAGFSILKHGIEYSGHHSGVSHTQTVQPGRLSYESSAMVSLHDAIRKGFAGGKLFIGNEEKESRGSAMTARKYGRFLKKFEAQYQFVSDTHSSISFRWFVDSDNMRHGASLKASATITLQKTASEADAERAARMIRYAIKVDERSTVFDLMDDALGVRRPEQ